MSYVLTILIIAGSFVLVMLVKKWQKKELSRMNSLNVKLSVKDKNLMRFISALSSVLVIIINTLMKTVVRFFTRNEQHETLTKMNVSVAFKLTFARFFNSSFVLLLVNEVPTTWFKGGNLFYDAQILIIILAF